MSHSIPCPSPVRGPISDAGAASVHRALTGEGLSPTRTTIPSPYAAAVPTWATRTDVHDYDLPSEPQTVCHELPIDEIAVEHESGGKTYTGSIAVTLSQYEGDEPVVALLAWKPDTSIGDPVAVRALGAALLAAAVRLEQARAEWLAVREDVAA